MPKWFISRRVLLRLVTQDQQLAFSRRLVEPFPSKKGLIENAKYIFASNWDRTRPSRITTIVCGRGGRTGRCRGHRRRSSW